MEVMEDGNLMDKVHVLIQRDMEYYKEKQAILQETICPGTVGGRLDFPRYVSFASMKLVIWWEEEYVAAFRKSSGFMQPSAEDIDGAIEASGGCGGIVKASDPLKFISMISKSSDQLLDHLHMLTQEALDHADLTVLTGTIGAAALMKNCLWCYIQSAPEKVSQMTDLQTCQKKYQEMCEALAERLLDLHTRLLSLYILQDAECLDWENTKPFFENERSSYVIQMWWLYMQGTKQDLWSTVPPKMAQRVSSGMLNETLTILTVRYMQACPSECRSQLLAVDISNILLCVMQLLPAICSSSDELIGLNLSSQSKILRDIHAKCQELLTCLLLRGCPLDILHKAFKRGLDSIEILQSRNNGPCPWILFALPNLFTGVPRNLSKFTNLPNNIAIGLELLVLLSQPQPNWSLLLKVLCMKECKVLQVILTATLEKYTKSCTLQTTPTILMGCSGFLCPKDGTCNQVDTSVKKLTSSHYYDLVNACSHVLFSVGNESDFSFIFLGNIDKYENWAQCFDRRHVWNQIRPPWFEAIIELIKPILPSIVATVINAVKTGASMYQAMSIILGCFSQLWDCINPVIPQITALIQDILPADVVPLGKSTTLQVLLSALYSELLKKSQDVKQVNFADEQLATSSKLAEPSFQHKNSITSFDGTVSSSDAIALAVAEAVCSIDEDNKHTEQIELFVEQIRASLETDIVANDGSKRVEKSLQMCEILVSDLLMYNAGKKSLKALNHFILNNHEWLYQALQINETNTIFQPDVVVLEPDPLLHTMFHIGNKPFDQLLTGEWIPDWSSLLHIPMGLSVERVWSQIQMRWEFRDVNSPSLSSHDAHIVSRLTSILKQN